MRQFTTAAKRGVAGVNNPIDITFEYEVREGEFVEMTAHPPTTGQLALFMGSGGARGMSSVRALFEFLATVLDERDYAIIEEQLRDGLDLQVIIDVVQYLSTEWSARPTSQPSGSSQSRRSTGRRSTVRPLPAASTS